MTVILSPFVPPAPLIVGVVSDVLLSVDEVPESDDGARSGTDGDNGAIASTTNDNAELAADELPARSVTVEVTDHVPSDMAGKSHDVAGTT